jgi:acyl phosphate:glycerol-3-phosphate acyltransferase
MDAFPGIAAVIAGYFIGSFPTAYIVTKIRKGVDIRDIDVGNMGAAAVRRQIGFVPGLIVALVDIAKGSSAVLLAQHLADDIFLCVYAAGFAALIGHCYPLYIGFRGGQGTATMIGIFTVLAPLAILIMLPLLGIVLLVVRRIYPMVIISSPALPVLIWFMTGSLPLTIYSVILILFIASRNVKGISVEYAKLRNRFNR